jgi:hypothetical protein
MPTESASESVSALAYQRIPDGTVSRERVVNRAKLPKAFVTGKLVKLLETPPKGVYDHGCRHPPSTEDNMLYWKIRAAGIAATLASLAAFAGLGKVW